MNDNDSTSSRKLDHVRIVMDEDVAAKGVLHRLCGLPYAARRAARAGSGRRSTPATTLLGKPMRAPLLISSMTGGAARCRADQPGAGRGGRGAWAWRWASARSARPFAMQRLAYTYQVRQVAPHIPLLANLGAVQLNYGYGVDECRRAVEMIEADALILHFNALAGGGAARGQHELQGLAGARSSRFAATVGVPVIAKEVGNGIGAQAARRLIEAGVWGIDVAGAGGTSWSEVERFRQTSARGRARGRRIRRLGHPHHRGDPPGARGPARRSR